MDTINLIIMLAGALMPAIVALTGAVAAYVRRNNVRNAERARLLQRMDALERHLAALPCGAHTERLVRVEAQKEALDKLTDGLVRVLGERNAPTGA